MTEQELRHQLELLQQSHARLKRLVWVGFLFLAGLGTLMGARRISQPIVETQALVLTDPKGRIRGMLSATESESGMVFTDHLGNKKLKFLVSGGEPQIVFLDNKEYPTLKLHGRENGGSSLELFAGDHQPQLLLQGSETNPQLQFFGVKGKPRMSLFSLEENFQDQAAGLSVMDSQGRVRVLISHLPELGGNLRVTNPEGEPIFRVP